MHTPVPEAGWPLPGLSGPGCSWETCRELDSRWCGPGTPPSGPPRGCTSDLRLPGDQLWPPGPEGDQEEDGPAQKERATPHGLISCCVTLGNALPSLCLTYQRDRDTPTRPDRWQAPCPREPPLQTVKAPQPTVHRLPAPQRQGHSPRDRDTAPDRSLRGRQPQGGSASGPHAGDDPEKDRSDPEPCRPLPTLQGRWPVPGARLRPQTQQPPSTPPLGGPGTRRDGKENRDSPRVWGWSDTTSSPAIPWVRKGNRGRGQPTGGARNSLAARRGPHSVTETRPSGPGARQEDTQPAAHGRRTNGRWSLCPKGCDSDERYQGH